MTDLTTLQLAEKIARAVLTGVDADEIALVPHDSYFPDLTWDVLKVLHDTGTWFCRLRETPEGTAVQPMPLECPTDGPRRRNYD